MWLVWFAAKSTLSSHYIRIRFRRVLCKKQSIYLYCKMYILGVSICEKGTRCLVLVRFWFVFVVTRSSFTRLLLGLKSPCAEQKIYNICKSETLKTLINTW